MPFALFLVHIIILSFSSVWGFQLTGLQLRPLCTLPRLFKEICTVYLITWFISFVATCFLLNSGVFHRKVSMACGIEEAK